MKKLNELWLKIPEGTREILKEVWRWCVATLYSIVLQVIVEFSASGQLEKLDLSVLKVMLGVIAVRFLDRVVFVAKGSNQLTKVLSLSK